ncbi:PREDICTED: C4b-binding protein alpha chain-like [Chinchilla lanigera]|uniref:C4b-binding protein alpha chain-like n=1 Tax=Chinchilla lanigera TaxID=34839 RepID=UPI00038F0077|nr:PREDICTED: C4b-binding protein alpha chain-like [Chinchilla lanigera]
MGFMPGSSCSSLCLLGALALLLRPSNSQGCGSPPVIPHGHYTYLTGYLALTTEVQYECNEGYALVGAAIISCRFLGWSSPAPQCQALCLKPKLPNGKLSVDKEQYISPETITVRCDPGYRMVGSQRISCSENKSWSPAVPSCEKQVPEDRNIVQAGKNLLQCLPSPRDSKMALELHKLSLEIEKLEQERDKGKII